MTAVINGIFKSEKGTVLLFAPEKKQEAPVKIGVTIKYDASKLNAAFSAFAIAFSKPVFACQESRLQKALKAVERQRKGIEEPPVLTLEEHRRVQRKVDVIRAYDKAQDKHESKRMGR